MELKRQISAADLRAEVARSGLPHYIVGAMVRIHPVTLSKILRGRIALSDKVAHRVLEALRAREGARAR